MTAGHMISGALLQPVLLQKSNYKQQSDEVFVISEIIKVEASVISLDLDYSGYHKNRIQLFFYYTLFYGKYTKTIL